MGAFQLSWNGPSVGQQIRISVNQYLSEVAFD